MNRWLFRLGTGLAFAVPLVLLSFALAGAEGNEAAPAAKGLTCAACHSDFYEAWQEGSHGRAKVDPAFDQAWKAQGSPSQCLTCHTTGYDPVAGTYKATGITCEACNNPVTDNHPDQPMASDRSAALCGTCHTETFFEWQVSKHRDVDLACVGCHDVHGTTLLAQDASVLCAQCHRERASNFAHSAHSQVGLTCADCHLGPLTGQSGEGHATRDHSFSVKLSACNTCHAYQMHDPVQVHPDKAAPEPAQDAMAAVETLQVSAVPEPASPVGYAGLAGLVGLALGVVLAPWLERLYHRNHHDDR